MHPFFYPFGYELPAYWLMGMFGICAAALFAFLRRRKAGFPGEDILYIGLMAIVGALVGAKLLHIITLVPLLVQNLDIFLENPAALVEAIMGGGVFYGGVLGGGAAVFLYCRRYKLPIKKVLAFYIPAVPLFHTFGRVGCFLAGCCWGIEHAHGVVYTQSLAAPNGIPLLPIQLIEAGCNLMMFVMLLIASNRLKKPHNVFPLYLIFYGITRFVLEFFRGDTVRGIALLSTSQWISIGLVVFSIALLIWERISTKKPT